MKYAPPAMVVIGFMESDVQPHHGNVGTFVVTDWYPNPNGWYPDPSGWRPPSTEHPNPSGW